MTLSKLEQQLNSNTFLGSNLSNHRTESRNKEFLSLMEYFGGEWSSEKLFLIVRWGKVRCVRLSFPFFKIQYRLELISFETWHFINRTIVRPFSSYNMVITMKEETILLKKETFIWTLLGPFLCSFYALKIIFHPYTPYYSP